jgi:hypothetical protein
MSLEINLRCPGCGNGVFLSGASGACSRCGKTAEAFHLPGPGEPLSACAVCGRRDLYRQRDFNRNLGVGIATAACLAAFVLLLNNLWFWGLGTLVGAAVLDLGLYLSLSQIVICYACGAIHRGFAFDPGLKGYSLMLADLHEKRAGREPVGGRHA